MIMDRYLVFTISHLANIWPYQPKEGQKYMKEKQEKQTACLGVYVNNIMIKYLGGISEELEPFRNRHKKSELFPPSRLLSVKMSLLCLSTRWQTRIHSFYVTEDRLMVNLTMNLKCLLVDKLLNLLFLVGLTFHFD